MAKKKQAPELMFQQHLAEDHLWAFLNATQADTLKKLADDYGTDARDEMMNKNRI